MHRSLGLTVLSPDINHDRGGANSLDDAPDPVLATATNVDSVISETVTNTIGVS